MSDEQTPATVTGADTDGDGSAGETESAPVVDGDDDEAASDTESDASVDADDEADDEARSGRVEDTTPPEGEHERDGDDGVETVPTVELDLYDLSVRVSGQSTDDLDAVGDAARELMDYLVEQSRSLEDRPDDRGLS